MFILEVILLLAQFQHIFWDGAIFEIRGHRDTKTLMRSEVGCAVVFVGVLNKLL